MNHDSPHKKKRFTSFKPHARFTSLNSGLCSFRNLQNPRIITRVQIQSRRFSKILKQKLEKSEIFFVFVFHHDLAVAKKSREMATQMRVLALGFLLFSTICWEKSYVSAMELRVSNHSMSSTVTAMYLLGDSSVDCGENTPFYSILHQNLSMYPCNGSDSSLVPQLLGNSDPCLTYLHTMGSRNF